MEDDYATEKESRGSFTSEPSFLALFHGARSALLWAAVRQSITRRGAASAPSVALPLFVSIDLIRKNLRLGMFLSGRVLRLVEVK